VVFLVLTSVLLLPIFSLYFLKIYQNQLIQQTETELIAQCAALSATMQREIQASIPPDVLLGAKIPPNGQKSPEDVYRPVSPKLELVNSDLLPPRPDARPPRPRRPPRAGSGRDPERDAGGISAARSERRRDRRP
jgi:hypothetical protein